MKRFAPLLAIIVLVGVLALLNKNINKGVSGDEDAPPLPAPAAKTAAVAASDPLPPELTLGSPATAQYKITTGWVYDPATQADPAALAHALDAVKQSVAASDGRASAEIVNLDMPASDLSPQAQTVTGLGVAINGDAGAVAGQKDIALAGNPGEGDVSAANISAAMGAALAQKP